MATIRKGILGGFSGTVGSVVGGKWKQTSYMRGKAPKVHDANTQAQKEQRAKWALVQSYIAPLKDYLNTVYGSTFKGKSPLNLLTSDLIKNGLRGNYPNYKIWPDFNTPRIYGSLAYAPNITFYINGGLARFSWETPTGNGDAQDDDIAWPMFYNIEKRVVVFPNGTVKRSDGTYRVNLPYSWRHDTVDLYLVFTTADKKKCSSLYMENHIPDFFLN